MRARNSARTERGRSKEAVFRLEDYRDVEGPFDRIVSVGMFEHVGVGHYDTFFRKCAKILDKDGVFLLHTIGRSGPPSITNAWIAKYIFPGGYIPALSEVLPRDPALAARGHRRRNSPASLCRNAQGLARALPRSPRRGGTTLRRALCAHVGVLFGIVGNGFPRKRHGGVSDPDGETQGRGAANPRLYRSRRSTPARARSHLLSAASPCRRVNAPDAPRARGADAASLRSRVLIEHDLLRELVREIDPDLAFREPCVSQAPSYPPRRSISHIVCNGESRDQAFPSAPGSTIDRDLMALMQRSRSRRSDAVVE